MAHIVFRTNRPQELIAWYRNVLQAEVALANDMVSFLTYDDEHHRIAIAMLPGLVERPAMAVGVEHVAFTYGSAEDLFQTYGRLKADGIEPYWTVNHGPTLSFYYRDPDLNQIELQIDLHGDAAETNEWFEHSDFSVNPIGVRIDADDIIRRYRSGENPEQLFARPVIAPEEIAAQLPVPDGGPLSLKTPSDLSVGNH
ncbi:VOC family protein [Sphingobium xenophagum]|uniref:VOC family protein n=1 Tax=Sphingobium xenophagum TaxID=121428 RepID=UPI00286B71AA|nr:VOC family protein [Sphingobium xenophagum]